MDNDKKQARAARLKKMFAPGPEAMDYRVTPLLDTILKWLMFTVTILGVSVITSIPSLRQHSVQHPLRHRRLNRDEARLLRSTETIHLTRWQNHCIVRMLRLTPRTRVRRHRLGSLHHQHPRSDHDGLLQEQAIFQRRFRFIYCYRRERLLPRLHLGNHCYRQLAHLLH